MEAMFISSLIILSAFLWDVPKVSLKNDRNWFLFLVPYSNAGTVQICAALVVQPRVHSNAKKGRRKSKSNEKKILWAPVKRPFL